MEGSNTDKDSPMSNAEAQQEQQPLALGVEEKQALEQQSSEAVNEKIDPDQLKESELPKNETIATSEQQPGFSEDTVGKDTSDQANKSVAEKPVGHLETKDETLATKEEISASSEHETNFEVPSETTMEVDSVVKNAKEVEPQGTSETIITYEKPPIISDNTVEKSTSNQKDNAIVEQPEKYSKLDETPIIREEISAPPEHEKITEVPSESKMDVDPIVENTEEMQEVTDAMEPVEDQIDQQEAEVAPLETDTQQLSADAENLKGNDVIKTVDQAPAAESIQHNEDISMDMNSHDEPANQVMVTDEPEKLNDEFISTDDDINSVSAFYSVPVDLLQADKDLFVSLLAKFNDFEKMKSTNQFLEINYEQLQHSHKKKLELAKAELESASMEISKLMENQNKLNDEKKQLESTLRNVNGATDKNSRIINDLKLKIQDLEKSKTNVSELLESKQNQINDLNTEIKTLVDENRSIRQTIANIESSKESISAEVMKYKFDITKFERENKLLSDSRDWFETELKRATSEFERYRVEQSSKLATVSSELQTLKQNYELSQSSLKNYSSEVSRLTTKSGEQQFQIKELSDKLETQESQFMDQLAKKDHYIQVIEKSNKDKAQRINSLDKLYKDTAEKVKSDEGEYKKLFDELESKLISKDAKIEQLESLVSDLSNKGAQLEGSGFQISPFAQKTLKDMNSELSLTDLITELNNSRKEIVKEKRAKVKAENELANVLKQLELKWPLLESYKDKCADYERKEEKLRVMLNNLTNDKSNLSKTCDMLKKKVNESQLQVRNLTKYKIDLQRQLVILLTEMRYRESGEQMLTLEEKDYINKIVSSYGEIRDLDNTDTDRLITSRLSTFKDTTSLIKQNEKLLTVSRKLGEELESKETEGVGYIEEGENSAVQKAKEAISKLQQQVKTLETQLQAAINGRDMLQNLFDSGAATIGNQGDNAANGERFSKLVDELRAKKEEVAELKKSYETKIIELTLQMEKVKSEKSNISLELSKEKSTNELNQERVNSLQSNIEFLKKENEQLKSMLDKSQSNLSKLEVNLQSSNNSIVANKSSMIELEIKVKSLTAEKDVWKSVEEQLRGDISRLYNEKAESNKMIVQLQTLDSERQAHFKETIQRYANTVESLQREIDALRGKLDKSNSEISNILHSKNVDSKVYQKRIDLLVEESSSLKSTLVAKEKVISELETELAALKKRHATIDERKQTVLTSIANSSGNSDDANVLTEELKHAIEDLETATKDAAQYKELANATEQQLASLNETYQQYKNVAEEKINNLTENCESLKTQTSSLESERDLLKEELEGTKRDSELAKNEYTSKIEELNSSISTFETIKKNYEEKLELVKSDVKTKETTIGELNELLADKTNQINTLETINNIIKKESDDLKEKISVIEAQVSQSEELLKDERERNKDVVSKLEQDVRNDKIRISELETQNRTLLNQLEESPLAFSESDDMKSLVSYLNREKDSLSQQLEYVQSEESILRQTINSREKEISELKSELVIVKEHSSTIDKYSEALKKMKGEVAELEVYKENNNVLRNHAKIYETKIKELESQLSQVSSNINPLTVEINNLKSEVANKDSQISQLNSQLLSMSKQLEASAVSESNNSEVLNQIADLRAKYDERGQSLEKLKNQFNERLIKIRGEKQQANEQTKELAAKVEELEKQLVTASTVTSNNDETEKLKSQVRLLKEELHQKTIENNNISKQSSETVNKITEELEALKKQVGESNTSSNIDLAALEQKYNKEKEEALKKLEVELTSKGGNMSSAELEEFKKKLKQENDIKLHQEIEAHKTRVRAPTQAKINEIVERRVKAKTEELEKAHGERMKELESKYSSGSGSGSGSSIDLAKVKDEMVKKFEEEKEQLKQEIRTAVEKEKGFKEKFLQGKINRLEEQVKKLEESKKNNNNNFNNVNSQPFMNIAGMSNMPNMPNMPNMANMANMANMPNVSTMGNLSNSGTKSNTGNMNTNPVNMPYNFQSPPFFKNQTYVRPSVANNNKGGFNNKNNNNNNNKGNSSISSPGNKDKTLPTKPGKRGHDETDEPGKRNKTE